MSHFIGKFLRFLACGVLCAFAVEIILTGLVLEWGGIHHYRHEVFTGLYVLVPVCFALATGWGLAAKGRGR